MKKGLTLLFNVQSLFIYFKVITIYDYRNCLELLYSVDEFVDIHSLH